MYSELLRKTIIGSYQQTLREPEGELKHPFVTPGSEAYSAMLWDWDSWAYNWSLRQIALESDDTAAVLETIRPYEQGCVLNFLECKTAEMGYIPIYIEGRGASLEGKGAKIPENIRKGNMHKPCLAQHAAFLIREDGGDAEWLRDSLKPLMAFVNFYRNHHFHQATGLYYWHDDFAIGVDNDPCTYGRPENSSGSIYLNCLMVKELEAITYIANQLNLNEVAEGYARDAVNLKASIQEHCWDEWTGFFYSVDLNIRRDIDPLEQEWGNNWGLHCGYPPDWDCLIQRIGVWSGFLGLWAGVATQEQAERIVQEHYRNEKTFGSAFGVRTLSRMEKMYNLRPVGNPSSWLGPIWGISNYLTWSGMLKYGMEDDARDLAEKTVKLFGSDLKRFGDFHESYQPDNGEPLVNKGFQSWNLLVLNMLAWLEGRPVIREF